MENARLDEAQAGIKIARRNINNLRYNIYGIVEMSAEEGNKLELNLLIIWMMSQL